MSARPPHPFTTADTQDDDIGGTDGERQELRSPAELHPEGEGRDKQTTTYGNWPSEAGPPTANTMEGMPGVDSSHQPQPSTLKKDYKYDKDHADYKYVRCKEIDEDQYKKLQDHTAKADQDWNFYNNNCATWSGDTWKDVTGEGLYYGKYMPATYDAPANLGSSIIDANGGTNTNIVGGF